ncbi:MAG: hypothetical protein Q9183_007307, partial [Haloplaca sp. 2 TL-2023]
MFKIPLINTKLVLETDEYDPVPITRLNNTDEWSFSDSASEESAEAPSSDDDEATREQEQRDLKEHLGDEEYAALVQAASAGREDAKEESRQERRKRKR